MNDDLASARAERTQKIPSQNVKDFLKKLTTKEGLVGDYDYGFLFRPNLPFMRKRRTPAPFFGLNDSIPVTLMILLGFQHALAMLAGIITPPMLVAGQSGANLDPELTQYLVSAALIISGILSALQIKRFHIPKTPFNFGTGMLTVVGTSFTIVSVTPGLFKQMYSTGFCPTDANGAPLPCPDGYGAILGTSCVGALIQLLLSFLPPRFLQKIFPPIVTGPTVFLIGTSLIQTGFEGWSGGSGQCMSRPATGPYTVCPQVGAAHALPWGSAQYIGLGFLVFLTIILCERFGSPIMKTTAVVLGLLVGCIVAAACGYFDRTQIDSAPAATFIWVHTFRLTVYGPLVLPMLVVYILFVMEAMGDVTAASDVSLLPVTGPAFDSRVQGGIFADSINGILAALMTMTPMIQFGQNNGVIALTRCANRYAGYACCVWLLIMGIFSKFAAALVAIPAPVLGGMTTFLFGAVAASGLRIIALVPFTTRNRFILTACMCVGLGVILVPNWFSYVFTYHGPNRALTSFFNAIELVMETSFAVTAFIAFILNLVLPEEESVSVGEEPQSHADGDPERKEWEVERGDSRGGMGDAEKGLGYVQQGSA